MLLLVFLKDAAHRGQREYRFAVWAENEPQEERVDLEVSPALVDAMWKPRQEPTAPRRKTFCSPPGPVASSAHPCERSWGQVSRWSTGSPSYGSPTRTAELIGAEVAWFRSAGDDRRPERPHRPISGSGGA